MRMTRRAGAVAVIAALVGAVGLGHPVGSSPANKRIFHAAPGGAPAGLCVTGQVKPGRPGAPILRRLPIASANAGVADERTGRVFVASGFGAGGICTLDARSGVVLNTTPIGGATALAVDPLTDRVFVANQGARSVSVLDARTGRLLRTVRLRGDPIVVTVDAATGRIFLADGHDDLISVLDARTGALLHSVQDGGPLAIAVSAPPSRVLVADFEGSSVRVLDARTGAPLRTIPVGSGPHSQPQAIAVDPATARAFVSSQDLTLSVLDTHTDRLLRTVHLDTIPAEVVADIPTPARARRCARSGCPTPPAWRRSMHERGARSWR